MAAFDQPHCMRQRLPNHGVCHHANPWPSRIHQNARSLHVASSAGVEHQFPLVSPFRARAAGASPNDGAMLGGIKRIEHYQTGIVDNQDSVAIRTTNVASVAWSGVFTAGRKSR